jgi:hypothetical protein
MVYCCTISTAPRKIARDIKRDWQGLWQLTDRKIRLRDELRAYFRSRDEDSTGV